MKLNLGSGQRPFQPPWLNVDAQETFHPDMVLDLKQPWPWNDASAEMIVFHHCWEHEGCGEAMHFQQEAYRVLRPGGSLLVFVPDMRALAQRWLMGLITTQVFMTNVYGAYMGSEHDRHKWSYDQESLRQELKLCNWSHVKPFDWRDIPGMDAARDWWILAIEAIK